MHLHHLATRLRGAWLRDGTHLDLVGGFTRQEDGEGGDVGDLHELLGRLGVEQDVVHHLLARHPARLHRVGDLPLDQRRPDIAGADAVGGDPGVGDFERDGLGQPDQPVLGGDIGRFERRGDERVRRRGGDDPPPFLAAHHRHRMADRVEGRGQVEMLCSYQVKQGLIVKALFQLGEPVLF